MLLSKCHGEIREIHVEIFMEFHSISLQLKETSKDDAKAQLSPDPLLGMKAKVH